MFRLYHLLVFLLVLIAAKFVFETRYMYQMMDKDTLHYKKFTLKDEFHRRKRRPYLDRTRIMQEHSKNSNKIKKESETKKRKRVESPFEREQRRVKRDMKGDNEEGSSSFAPDDTSSVPTPAPKKQNKSNHREKLNLSIELPSSESSNSIINYYLHTNQFVNTLSSCLTDPECHVIYHHIMKTGGKTIEFRMFQAFPFSEEEPQLKACCFTQLMQRFNHNKKEYCAARFVSYEIKSDQMEKIVKSCIRRNGKHSRIVVMVSFRDPDTRTLSYVHQICNKNFEFRRENLKHACRICNYENSTKEALDFFPKNTNKAFQYILNTTKLSTMDQVTVLTLEMEDINAMFMDLGKSLKIEFPMNVTVNEEEQHICDFGIKSGMLKQLGASREVYRKLLTGLI